jgi:LPXTG-motif cell wall-anchored protein
MKIRVLLCAAAAAALALPTAAHAGIARANCGPNGVVTLESADDALLLHPNLWDFEVRVASINGTPVGFTLSSGTNDYEQFTLDSPVANGDVIEFEFREVRNARENGDGYVSEWKLNRVEVQSCPQAPPPPSSDTPPTSAAAPQPTPPSPPSTAGAPTTVVSPDGSGPPQLPTLPPQTTSGAQLPETGGDTSTLFAVAAAMLALGALSVILTRRPQRTR